MLGAAAGFVISYAFVPKYTSASLILMEEQKIPEDYVHPLITDDLGQRIATLKQRALSAENLRPTIASLNLSHGDSVRKLDGVHPVYATS